MTESPLYDITDPEEGRVVAWRMECFERAGFAQLEASALALRRDVDRAVVERMVEDGAPPELIAEIVL